MINYYYDNANPLKPYKYSLEATDNTVPPDNAVRIAPPPYDERTHCPCLINGKWELVENHIGKMAFNVETLEREIVNYLGPLKDGFTLLVPNGPYDQWDGKKWESPPRDYQPSFYGGFQAGSCSAYITESYHNGESWYNLYSNGFIEQSGVIFPDTPQLRTISITVVNLLKPMQTQNYAIDLSLAGYSSWGWVRYTWGDRYSNRFYVCGFTEANPSKNKLRWTVRGY